MSPCLTREPSIFSMMIVHCILFLSSPLCHSFPIHGDHSFMMFFISSQPAPTTALPYSNASNTISAFATH